MGPRIAAAEDATTSVRQRVCLLSRFLGLLNRSSPKIVWERGERQQISACRFEVIGASRELLGSASMFGP